LVNNSDNIPVCWKNLAGIGANVSIKKFGTLKEVVILLSLHGRKLYLNYFHSILMVGGGRGGYTFAKNPPPSCVYALSSRYGRTKVVQLCCMIK